MTTLRGEGEGFQRWCLRCCVPSHIIEDLDAFDLAKYPSATARMELGDTSLYFDASGRFLGLATEAGMVSHRGILG